MRLIYLCAFLLSWTLPSWAQTGEMHYRLAPKHLPHLTHLEGGNLRLSWDDGRVAETWVEASNPSVEKFKVSLRESTCPEGDELPPTANCKMTFPYRRLVPRMVWVKHPDLQKVGQDVIKTDGNSKVVEMEVFLDPFSRRKFPLLLKDLKNVELTCDRWEWLPSQKTQSSFSVIDWSVQNMSDNPQTGVPENRLDTISQNVSARWENPQTLELVNNERRSTFGGLLYFTGDMIAWTVKAKEGKFCDVDLTRGPLDQIESSVTGAEIHRLHQDTEGLWKEYFGVTNYGYVKNSAAFGEQADLAEALDHLGLFGGSQNATEQGIDFTEYLIQEVE
jgi:hypothetical protein